MTITLTYGEATPIRHLTALWVESGNRHYDPELV